MFSLQDWKGNRLGTEVALLLCWVYYGHMAECVHIKTTLYKMYVYVYLCLYRIRCDQSICPNSDLTKCHVAPTAKHFLHIKVVKFK